MTVKNAFAKIKDMPMPPFPGGSRPMHGMRSRRTSVPQEEPKQFDSLRASLLFCPKCQTATPARERLLLVLPTGNLYEYMCSKCGTSTGSKTDQVQSEGLIVP